MAVFVPSSVPRAARGQVQRLVECLGTFSRIHKVQEKESKRLIPFVPMPMQEKIFTAVEQGYNRIAVIKARQTTATTGCKMVLHQMAYATPNEAMHAVISMRSDSASMLLDDHRRWLKDPPKLLRRPIKTQARNRIVYDDTGASIQAFTSRSVTGLRSFTPVAALVSEAAFAPDLEETIAQADAAVGDEGLLILESTANAPGDHFSKLVQGAPENGWHLITMWWWEHPKYTDDDTLIPADFTYTEAEQQLQTKYGLTRNQLHWRRRKVGQLGITKFRREYPACMDDCFLGRDGGYYDDEVMQAIDVVEHTAMGSAAGREIEAPHKGDRYVMGVDIGGGVRGDYSTIAVVSVATRQPVYSVRSNTVTPAQWAHRAVQVASRYNNALMLYESNNHGHAFGLELGYTRYNQVWRDPKTGKPWTTTLPSKLDAFDTLREALGVVQIMDRVTWLELRSLTIPKGKVAPEAPKGGYDDSAVALALAYRCLRDIPPSWRTTAVASKGVRVADLLTKSRARRVRAAGLPFS